MRMNDRKISENERVDIPENDVLVGSERSFIGGFNLIAPYRPLKGRQHAKEELESIVSGKTENVSGDDSKE